MSTDKLDKAINRMLETVALSRFYGVTNPTVNAEVLDEDGRTRKSLVKHLASKGFAVANDPNKPDILEIQGLLYEVLSSAEVDLVKAWEDRKGAYYKPWRNRAIAAVKLDSLPPQQLKAVFVNRKNFKFYFGPDADHIIEFQKPMLPAVVGDAAAYDKLRKELESHKGGWGSFYASNDELVHHVQQTIYNEQVAALLPKNLFFGLDKLGYLFQLDRDRAKKLFANSDNMPFHSSAVFGLKREEWEKQLEENQVNIAKEIAELAQNLLMLQSVSANLKKDGGWTKFHTEYEQLVRETVKKEGNSFTVYPV